MWGAAGYKSICNNNTSRVKKSGPEAIASSIAGPTLLQHIVKVLPCLITLLVVEVDDI